MAKIIVTATNKEDLQEVNNLVHDLFFDVDDIAFDLDHAVLSFKFVLPPLERSLGLREFLYSSKGSAGVDSLLKIHNVERYSINDSEKVGRYDFNIIEFEPTTRLINVRTNIPIDITILVRSLKLTIEV